MKLKLPKEVRANDFFIGGKWQSCEDRERLVRQSPGHGVPVSSVTLCTSDDVNKAVKAARDAFENIWSETPGAARGRILIKAAQGIRDRLDEMAYWETLETGKPISQAKAEIEAAADHYEAAAGMASEIAIKLVFDETVQAGNGISNLTLQPYLSVLL